VLTEARATYIGRGRLRERVPGEMEGAPCIRIVRPFQGLKTGDCVWVLRKSKRRDERQTWFVGILKDGTRVEFPETSVDREELNAAKMSARVLPGENRRRMEKTAGKRTVNLNVASVLKLRPGFLQIEGRDDFRVERVFLRESYKTTRDVSKFVLQSGVHILCIDKSLIDILKDSTPVIFLQIIENTSGKAELLQLSLLGIIQFPQTIIEIVTGSVRTWFTRDKSVQPKGISKSVTFDSPELVQFEFVLESVDSISVKLSAAQISVDLAGVTAAAGRPDKSSISFAHCSNFAPVVQAALVLHERVSISGITRRELFLGILRIRLLERTGQVVAETSGSSALLLRKGSRSFSLWQSSKFGKFHVATVNIKVSIDLALPLLEFPTQISSPFKVDEKEKQDLSKLNPTAESASVQLGKLLKPVEDASTLSLEEKSMVTTSLSPEVFSPSPSPSSSSSSSSSLHSFCSIEKNDDEVSLQKEDEDKECNKSNESEKSVATTSPGKMFTPLEVVKALLEQDRIEAVRRGLNGHLKLPRELIWKIIADLGLWDGASKHLGRLKPDSDITLPLLDEGALAASLGLSGGSLVVKQIRRGLFKLLAVPELETYFEKQLLSEAEQAAAGVKFDESGRMEPQNNQCVWTKPLSSWKTEDLSHFVQRLGGNAQKLLHAGLLGKELLELESHGSFSLAEGISSLDVGDDFISQKLQYQLSLLILRQRENPPRRSHRESITHSDLDDNPWWAGGGFGVRARKRLSNWSLEDICKFAAFLRFPETTVAKIHAFAIDGVALQELSTKEMVEELCLSKHEAEVLEAAILLLKRPPEFDLGNSGYLQLRITNDADAMSFDGDQILCLEPDRVHTIIIRPGPLLLHAVDHASKHISRDLDQGNAKPAIRIWFRLLEYKRMEEPQVSSVPWRNSFMKAKHDENQSSKNKIRQAKPKKGREASRSCARFSDARAGSVTTVIREKINGDKDINLTRWDPLHKLLKNRNAIVNGWRYLVTTSIDRGLDEECARLSLCIDSTAMEAHRSSKQELLCKLCFVVQIGMMKSFESEMKVLFVPENDDKTSKLSLATHLFTLSPCFRVFSRLEKDLPENAARVSKTNNNKKKKNVNGKGAAKKMEAKSFKRKAEVSKTTSITGSKGSENTTQAQAKVYSPKKPQRKIRYADSYQREQLANLERSRREAELEAESEREKRKEAEEAQTLRAKAAFELGSLVRSSSQQFPPTSPFNLSTEDLQSLARSQLHQLRLGPDALKTARTSSSSSLSSASPSLTDNEDNEWLQVSPDQAKEQELDRKTAWVEEMFAVSDEEEKDDSGGENDDDEEEDNPSSDWAGRVQEQFLAQNSSALTYPLRPSSLTAEKCIQKLRLALDRVGDELSFARLAISDLQCSGWLSHDQFLEFVRDLAHGDELLFKDFLDISREWETNKPTLIKTVKGQKFVRYERVVNLWSQDEQSFVTALATRLWRKADLDEFELLHGLERHIPVQIELLRELDPDLAQNEFDLLVDFNSNKSLLLMPLLRVEKAKCWDYIVSKLKEKRDLLPFAKSTAKLTLEEFTTHLRQFVSVELHPDDLRDIFDFCAMSDGIIDCGEIFEASQFSNSIDLTALLEHLQRADVDADGRVSANDMFHGLCLSMKKKHNNLDSVRALARDYEKRLITYIRWMELNLDLSRQKAAEFETQRLCLWFSRKDESERSRILQQGNGLDLMEFFKQQGFESHLFMDIVQDSNVQSAIAHVLQRANALCDTTEASKQTAHFIVGTMIEKKVDGGITELLRRLEERDLNAVGIVLIEDFCSALNCDMKDLEFVFDLDATTEVTFEVFLEEAFNTFRPSRSYVGAFTEHKIRRAVKRFRLENLNIFDTMASHDETFSGFLSLHEFSWELKKFDIHLACQGFEAQYLLKRYGDHGTSFERPFIDYEMILLESMLDIAMSKGEQSSAKKEFLCCFLRRKLKGSDQSKVGILQVFDDVLMHEYSQGKTGISDGFCSSREAELVLRKSFAPRSHADEPKLSLAVKLVNELYSSHNGLVNFRKLAAETAGPETEVLDQARHVLSKFVAFKKRVARNLFDAFRKCDGDLNGTVSTRNINEALGVLGAEPITDDACRLADAFVSDGVIAYERLLNNAELVVARRKPSKEKRISPQFLEAVLRRINENVMRLNNHVSSRAVFLSLVGPSSETLTEWDMFFLLRQHHVHIDTIEELRPALRTILQHLKGSVSILQTLSEETMSINLNTWLRIVTPQI